VDDHTVFTVLHKLLYLDGQRLSYKALDVEQIGSVYEALMGFDIQRLTSGAVRIKLGSKKGAAPAPTAMKIKATKAISGWISPGAATMPASAVKIASDITRGFSSAK
jgi:hypothetical protein